MEDCMQGASQPCLPIGEVKYAYKTDMVLSEVGLDVF